MSKHKGPLGERKKHSITSPRSKPKSSLSENCYFERTFRLIKESIPWWVLEMWEQNHSNSRVTWYCSNIYRLTRSYFSSYWTTISTTIEPFQELKNCHLREPCLIIQIQPVNNIIKWERQLGVELIANIYSLIKLDERLQVFTPSKHLLQ